MGLKGAKTSLMSLNYDVLHGQCHCGASKKASLCLVSSERLIFIHWMEVVFEKVISTEEEEKKVSVSFFYNHASQ